MRTIEGNPAEAGEALRAVLRAMSLGPTKQLALFPEPDECVTCSISTQYSELMARYGQAAFFRELTEPQADALARVEEAARLAGECPCHEPQRLKKTGFIALRKRATAALEALGWSAGDPDPVFLFGREEYATRWRAESERRKRQRRAGRAKGSAPDDFSDVPEFDPRGQSVDAFRERLDRVPWFAHLGEPHPLDPFVDRIKDWEEWGGPESRGVQPMGPESGRWNEDLMAMPDTGPEAMRTLWESVEGQAFRRMPFELEGDPWHGPTAASSQAAWLAATIACCLRAGAPIPRNALRQWAWFARGHWPCGFSDDDELPLDENHQYVREALEAARLVVY